MESSYYSELDLKQVLIDKTNLEKEEFESKWKQARKSNDYIKKAYKDQGKEVKLLKARIGRRNTKILAKKETIKKLEAALKAADKATVSQAKTIKELQEAASTASM